MEVISQIVLKRATLIEQNIVNVGIGSEIKFNSANVSRLTGKLIYAIDVVPAEVLAVSPNLRPVVAFADLANCTLTVIEQNTNEEFIWRSPSTRFIPQNLGGYTQYFSPRFIDWTQSFFRVNLVGTLDDTQSFVINAYWKNPNE